MGPVSGRIARVALASARDHPDDARRWQVWMRGVEAGVGDSDDDAIAIERQGGGLIEGRQWRADQGTGAVVVKRGRHILVNRRDLRKRPELRGDRLSTDRIEAD